jgi:hypothetical protein
VPKLKIDDDELPDDLDEVEYDKERRDYEKYEGEQPPKDTFLNGYVKNVWWTETNGGARMLKVLWIADGNTGELEEYNGLDVWENMAMTGPAKFKWGPFFEYFGLTIRMLKTQALIEEDEDNIGAQIKKIGKKFIPGPDCRVGIITSREKYNGNWQTHVAEWLDEEELEDEEPEEEEELDEEEEEEEDLEDEAEEEEEPEPPKRPTARRPAAASTTKTSARPTAAARPSAKSPAAKSNGTKSTSTAPKRSVSGTKPAVKPTARPASTKRRSAAVDDDPPF